MALPVRHYGKWRIRWLDEDGGRHSATFDDYKKALSEQRRLEVEVEQVKRGAAAPTQPDKTVGDALDYWIANRAPQKKNPKHDESIIRKHLRPTFGSRRLRDLNASHVDPFIVANKSLSKKTINNILTLLISVLRVANEIGWSARVPRIRKPRVRIFSHDYQWLRTDDEVQRLLAAAREIGELPFMFYATAIYTGMREGELAGLRRDDVHLDQRLIVVQRSYDGATKAEDLRYVPILDPLLPLLREWLLKTSGRLVFPNGAGNIHTPCWRLFRETLHEALDAAEFPKVERGGKVRWYIRFHDLRHSFASHWVMRGGDLFRLQKILGHKTVQMTQRYAHLAPDAFVGDYARLGSAAPLPTGKVIPLHPATSAAS